MKKILLSTLISCLFVLNLTAQDDKNASQDDVNTFKEAQYKWQVRVSGVAISPAPYFYDDISGGNAEYSTEIAPELDITYFMSKNMAFELMLTTATHEVEIEGSTELGEVSILPPTLSLQYHFYLGKFKPYLGAGFSYVLFYGEEPGDLDDSAYDNEPGYSIQTGVDYNLNDKWFLNLDFRKMYLKTEITPNGDSESSVIANFDPLFFGFGVGMKF